jgi:hypothetical protein
VWFHLEKVFGPDSTDTVCIKTLLRPADVFMYDAPNAIPLVKVPDVLITASVPVGRRWSGEGGVYVGIARARESGDCYHLIANVDAVVVSGWRWADGLDGESWVAKSNDDGWSNTQAMLDAGSRLAAHVRGLRTEGCDDWYLPSQTEVCLLAANLPDPLPCGRVWTSSQTWAESVWCLDGRGPSLHCAHVRSLAGAVAVRRLAV